MKTKLSLSLLLVFTLIGCGSLDPNGPYKGNKSLYSVDAGIAASYTVIDTFTDIELKNREALRKYPDILNTANRLRSEAPKALQSAVRLRDAWMKDPTDVNKSAYETAINLVEAMITEASTYMTQSTAYLLKK